jgi:hypothetical protein
LSCLFKKDQLSVQKGTPRSQPVLSWQQASGGRMSGGRIGIPAEAPAQTPSATASRVLCKSQCVAIQYEGGVETLMLATGIGENVSEVRARICDGLRFSGIELDKARRLRQTVYSRQAAGSQEIHLQTRRRPAGNSQLEMESGRNAERESAGWKRRMCLNRASSGKSSKWTNGVFTPEPAPRWDRVVRLFWLEDSQI